MNLWLALRRLLPLLAVLSLVLTPVTVPAATMGMHASMAQGHHASALGGTAAVPRMDHTHMENVGMGHHNPGSAHSAALDRAGMDMDDMPCCPKAEAAKPHCAKGCPLMALCLASVASLLPAVPSVPVPAATCASPSWPSTASFASVPKTLLPEPPRA